MPRLLNLALVALSLLIAPAPAGTRAAAPANRTAASPAGTLLSSLLADSPADESAILQNSLRATDEEWSIIYPKLAQIMALRAAVNADGPSASAGTSLMGRLTSGPLGGTSMDAPTMAGRRWGGRGSPFDPSLAPGAAARTSSGLGGALTRGLTRNWANSVKTGQGNSVRILLAELQTLLDDKNTNDKQLFDKLASIRTARSKAARDLDAAQTDLKLLLTTDQLAILVSIGYMD